MQGRSTNRPCSRLRRAGVVPLGIGPPDSGATAAPLGQVLARRRRSTPGRSAGRGAGRSASVARSAPTSPATCRFPHRASAAPHDARRTPKGAGPQAQGHCQLKGSCIWEVWWSWGDSNPRPFDCQSNALPTELQPHAVRRRSCPARSTSLRPTLPTRYCARSSFVIRVLLGCPPGRIRFTLG